MGGIQVEGERSERVLGGGGKEWVGFRGFLGVWFLGRVIFRGRCF